MLYNGSVRPPGTVFVTIDKLVFRNLKLKGEILLKNFIYKKELPLLQSKRAANGTKEKIFPLLTISVNCTIQLFFTSLQATLLHLRDNAKT